MKDVIQYHIHGFELTLHPEAYTVEVHKIPPTSTEDCPGDLPDWVFDSKNTIWFLGDGGPFLQRAQMGEKIRRRMYREVCRRKGN